MKVSLNWLKDLVDVNLTAKELYDLFNLHSAEVEEYYSLVEATNLVVGHVLEKEKHPDADKLSVCQVDLGDETTQIVCGAPNVAKGQKVIVSKVGAVLAGGLKIKAAKVRGVESNGMICSLGELGIDKKYHGEEGIHVLDETAEVGSDPIVELMLNDEVIALDLTPNRADLLSMLGVAYDVSAMTGSELHLTDYIVEESNEENDVNIELDTKHCYSYYARVIKDIVITDSPRWMQSRLIAAGMRPINNVVDITNYVMLETGQPLHAFDYDLLNSSTIKVRMANDGETLTTLDEQKRILTTDDIVITNGKDAIALGGVMGGFDTEITPTSTTILLESAEFSPVHIRKTSNRLDLRSEASMRFERKIDKERTLLALEMATKLFVDYASGTALKGISKVDNNNKEEQIITVSAAKINHVLGSDYSVDLLSETLDKLHFEYNLKNDVFDIKVPSRRRDIETYQDIVEEVGRIIGYDKLPLTLPETISVGKLSDYQIFRRKVRRTLEGLGLNEIITYTLVNQEEVYDFTKDKEDVVSLIKPMTIDRAVLRKTQLNGIVKMIRYNASHKMNDVAVYEIGHKYCVGNEEELLSGAITGEYSNVLWQGKKEQSDFFLLKGILESLFEELSLAHLTFEPMSDYKNLHPGQSAYIKNREEVIGFIGKLHPQYAKENGIKDVYVFELEMKKLYANKRPLKKVKEINKFPKIQRDIAIVVSKEIIASQIIDSIKTAGKRMLTNVHIFDLYEGENIGLDNKSLAIRLEFSDAKRTLETAEVDERVKSILSILKRAHGADLRE